MRRVDTMRKAKEVKVINRWKAEDFDGEIPIGGDEEMLGTAMKFASHMSGASEAVGLLKKAPGPLMYFGFYGLGGVTLLSQHFAVTVPVITTTMNLTPITYDTS